MLITREEPVRHGRLGESGRSSICRLIEVVVTALKGHKRINIIGFHT